MKVGLTFLKGSEFWKFLLEARLATYASVDNPKPVREADGTEVYTYPLKPDHGKPWTYTDRFRGFESFRGTERVEHRDFYLTWDLYYQGIALPGKNSVSREEFDAERIFNFLKEARRDCYRHGHLLMPEARYSTHGGAPASLRYEDHCRYEGLSLTGTEKILLGGGENEDLLFIMHYSGQLFGPKTQE